MVFPCLSSSSDDHLLLHTCLGTGMQFGNDASLSLSFIFGSLGAFICLLLSLVGAVLRHWGDPRLYVCQTPCPFWVHFGSILGLFWVYFGSILGLFWVHFGSILVPFWFHFGSILGPFWVHFGSILGPFWVHFGSILGPFWVHSGSILFIV